jgi:hypothetical protein
MGIQTEGLEILVAAGVVLCRHENQTRTSFRGTTLLHRGSAAGLQDTDDRSIRGDNANSDGEYYCKSENQRHEERNHGRPPLVFKFEKPGNKSQYSDAASPTFVYAASSIYLR